MGTASRNEVALPLLLACSAVAVSAGVAGQESASLSVDDEDAQMVHVKLGDGKGFTRIAKVPPSAVTYKHMKGSKAKCKAACAADKQCQGFKHVAGTTECSLLSHPAAKLRKAKGGKGTEGKHTTAVAKSKGKLSGKPLTAKQMVQKSVKKATATVSKIKKHRMAQMTASAAQQKAQAAATKHTLKMVKKVKVAAKGANKVAAKAKREAKKTTALREQTKAKKEMASTKKGRKKVKKKNRKQVTWKEMYELRN